jgi:hypothetical protein
MVEDMAIVHRVFRREFQALPDLVRAVPPGDIRSARIATEHARLILTALHLHHTSEDELLWPLLLERATPARGLVALMQTQHADIERLLVDLDPLVERFAATAEGGHELAQALERLTPALIKHLDLEEAEIVPLAADHLSAAEWSQLGAHGSKGMAPKQLPLMFGAILEEADDTERGIMLNVLPVPARLVLTTIGALYYRRYIRRVRTGAHRGRLHR